jgi:hypothetical protein
VKQSGTAIVLTCPATAAEKPALDYVNQNCELAADAKVEESAMILEMVEPFIPGIDPEENQWTLFHCCLC